MPPAKFTTVPLFLKWVPEPAITRVWLVPCGADAGVTEEMDALVETTVKVPSTYSAPV